MQQYPHLYKSLVNTRKKSNKIEKATYLCLYHTCLV